MHTWNILPPLELSRAAFMHQPVSSHFHSTFSLCFGFGPTKTVSLTYHPCKSYFNCLSLVSFFGREAAGRLEFPCFCSGVGTFLGMRFNWRPLVPCKLPFPRHGDLSLPLPVWGHCTKKIRGIWFGVHVDLHEQYITVVLERDMEDHVFFR